MATKKFKAGKYYIGDPCYVIANEDWSEFVNKSFDHEFFKHKGVDVFVGGTRYGDGVYQDDQGNDYAVDSGTIGLIPVKFVDEDDQSTYELGSIVEFSEDFLVTYFDGVYRIGPIEIDTQYDEEELDEEYP